MSFLTCLFIGGVSAIKSIVLKQSWQIKQNVEALADVAKKVEEIKAAN